jgi:hypothetical protein
MAAEKSVEVGDYSSENSEADVDMAKIKDLTRFFEQELIVYSLPLVLNVRRLGDGKDIVDFYISSSTQKPSKEDF